MTELADTIATLAPQTERNPAAMIQIVRMMRMDGQREEALAQCRKALALAPYDDAELAAMAKMLLSEDVPTQPMTPPCAAPFVPTRAFSKSAVARVSWR
jgi:hypothetical protein